MAETPLAVLLPAVGALSESFLRRHVVELCPGKVVAVASFELEHWRAQCPTLILDQKVGVLQQVRSRVRGRLGLPDGHISRSQRGAARNFLEEHNVRVILAEYLDHAVKWLPLAREMGIGFFAHGHGIDVSARLRESYWRKRYLELNASNGIITMSQASKRRLASHGINPSKLHVIPCGIDVPEMPNRRIASPQVRCIAVGRMVAKKAPLLTLEAFRRARMQFNDVSLDFIGSGPLLAAATQFVREHDLSEVVRLHGDQPPEVVHDLMRRADIFLQHSITDPLTGDEEGLPVAILEAMSHALPVIATQHAGIPEAIEDGESGFLVPEGDVEAMAARISRLVQSDDHRARLGIKAWETALAKFSWERERSQLLELLQLP
jgi:colanic acid/amylovoran biosynthesis glycosyltransferase